MSKMRDFDLSLLLSLSLLHLTGRQCLLTLVNERSGNSEEKGQKEVEGEKVDDEKTDFE